MIKLGVVVVVMVIVVMIGGVLVVVLEGWLWWRSGCGSGWW